MTARDLRTRFALKAVDVATLFATAFGHVRLGPGGYAPELTAPDGPSTGGGVQAVQHMRLVPSQPGLPTLVFGSANLKLSTAELRTFEHLDAIHQARFHRSVPLDRAEYEAFLDAVQRYLAAMKLTSTRAGPPEGGALSQRPSAPAPSGEVAPVLLVLLFFAVVGTAVAVLAYLRFHR